MICTFYHTSVLQCIAYFWKQILLFTRHRLAIVVDHMLCTYGFTTGLCNWCVEQIPEALLALLALSLQNVEISDAAPLFKDGSLALHVGGKS